MITLITGLPGHGKSLRLVAQLASDEYEGRPRFAHGIDGLDYEKLGVSDFSPTDWVTQLPDQSVAFIDECYKYYPSRSSHQRPPDYVEQFAEHRHRGLDFVMACQDPSQIDPFLRKLIDRHLHVRRNMGLGFTNIREFQGVHNAPGTDFAKKNAVTIQRWKFNKKLFSLYKSATAHTVKRRIPLKAYGAGLVVIACLVAIGNLVAWGMSFNEDVQETPQITFSDPLGPSMPADYIPYEAVAALPGTEHWDRQLAAYQSEYYAGRMEAISGLEYTQSIYAEVMEPVTFPKPRCVLMRTVRRCVCHSQQGTRMVMQYKQCEWFAMNGFFDPTIEDEDLMASSTTRSTSRRPFSSVARSSAETDSVKSESVNRLPAYTNWAPQPTVYR